MGHFSKEDIQNEAKARRDRILQHVTQDPPVPLKNILAMEGMQERSCRQIITELEAEHGFKYLGVHSKGPKDAAPYGLTSATHRLRQKLADHLYLLRERGNDSSKYGRSQIAPKIGLNNRDQIKAETKPFNYDWKLSDIERLARAHGRDPMEFLLQCLTT